ncbi:MAG: glycosyltransferase family 39 protein, partial [Candidatus Nanohaloarchaeota archaeon QJJ-7]|nr:glycosyltransferase family 39 protein [Candidatus Nanohaloarchaeota archaeon QJJ-7]
MSHLSNFLSNPWMVFLTINLALVVVFTSVNIRNFRDLFTGISRRTWIILGGVFLVGFLLFNQFYFFGTHTDGYNFIESSKGILETGHYFYRCDAGTVGNCLSYSKHTSPPGATLLISLVFLAIGGVNSYYALALSGIMMSLSILLVFLVSYLAFEREKLSLYASLIYATIPILVLWASTGHMRTFGLFFVLLSLLSFLSGMRLDDNKMWLLTIFSTAFAVYTVRSFLILPPIYIIFFLWEKKSGILEELRSDRLNDYLTLTGIGTLIFLPILKWIIIYEPTLQYNSPKFSIDYIPTKAFGLLLMYFGELGYYLIETNYYIPIISFLAFGYFIYISRNRSREYFLFGLIFLSLFILISGYIIYGFYSMEQTFSISQMRVFIGKNFIRHAISLTPFYAIIAAFSLSKIEEALERINENLKYAVPLLLVLVIA